MGHLSKARQLTALRAHAQRVVVKLDPSPRASFAEASLVAQEYLHHAQHQALDYADRATAEDILVSALLMCRGDKRRWETWSDPEAAREREEDIRNAGDR